MAHFDGTGPSGKGPMTGLAGGHCILRIPDDAREPVQGFVGMGGKRIVLSEKTGKENKTMPGGGGKGPEGQGPMTGRMAGYCGGRNAPGPSNRGSRGGFDGRGSKGGGFGRRNAFRATGLTGWQSADLGPGGALGAIPPGMSAGAASMEVSTGVDALELLKTQAGKAEAVLDGLKKRIEALESGTMEK